MSILNLSLFPFFILVILSSGSFFLCVICGRKYEEALPLTCTGIVLVLLACGMLGSLALGFWIICLCSLLLYFFGTVRLIKRGGIVPVIKRLFTPATIIFMLSLIALFYINYGRVIAASDEFTHWADCVKVLFYTGKLYTASSRTIFFATYPPGMSLFQFFFERLYCGLCRAPWADWVLFYSFQIFMISFFFPLLRGMSFRKPIISAITAAIVLISPLFMDASCPFSCLYIDPLLSVIFGCAVARVFIETERDFIFDVYIFCCCVMLVLAKTIGILFALYIAIMYILMLSSSEKDSLSKKRMKSFLALFSVFAPYILWQLEINITDAVQTYAPKTGSIDFDMLRTLVLHQGGNCWQQIVHDEYYARLFTDSFLIKGMYCPDWLFFLLSLAVLFTVTVILTSENSALNAAKKLLIPTFIVLSVIYYVGMCYMYVFKFDRFEAIELASVRRYKGILLFGLYTASISALAQLILRRKKDFLLSCLVLSLFLVLTPFGRALHLARRDDMQSTENKFPELIDLAEKVDTVAQGEPSKIFILCQGDRNTHYFVLHYLLHPNTIQSYGEWYLGPHPGPGFEDRLISPNEWIDDLRKNYDYLAISSLDDYFLEIYGSLFDDNSKPEAGSVYIIQDDALLTIVQ